MRRNLVGNRDDIAARFGQPGDVRPVPSPARRGCDIMKRTPAVENTTSDPPSIRIIQAGNRCALFDASML